MDFPNAQGAIKGKGNQAGVPLDALPSTLTSASVGLLKLNPNYASAQSMPKWLLTVIFRNSKRLEGNDRKSGKGSSLIIRSSLPFVGRDLSSYLWGAV